MTLQAEFLVKGCKQFPLCHKSAWRRAKAHICTCTLFTASRSVFHHLKQLLLRFERRRCVSYSIRVVSQPDCWPTQQSKVANAAATVKYVWQRCSCPCVGDLFKDDRRLTAELSAAGICTPHNMSKRPAQNGDGSWEANGEPPAQRIKIEPAQDGQDKPSDEVGPNTNFALFRASLVTRCCCRGCACMSTISAKTLGHGSGSKSLVERASAWAVSMWMRPVTHRGMRQHVAVESCARGALICLLTSFGSLLTIVTQRVARPSARMRT